MIIIGILLFIIGIMIKRFLNKSDPPAISVYEEVHLVPSLIKLVGVILIIIGLIKAF